MGSGSRGPTNASDSIYDASLLLPTTGSVADGYAGTFTVNLDFGDGGTTPTATPTRSPDEVVSASVLQARVVRRLGRRVVEVKLTGEEKVAARIRLVRNDDVLADKQTGWLPVGKHKVRMRVPGAVRPGYARVVVNLADAAGNTLIARQKVFVPAK